MHAQNATPPELARVSDRFAVRRGRAPRLCYLADARSSHTAKWVNHFSHKDFEVHLLSFEHPRGISSTVQFHKLSPGVATTFRYFTEAKQVKRIIANLQPDLVHAHYASGYGTLGRLSGFHPYVISVWGSDVFEFPSISPIHRFLLQKNLTGADLVLSTSHFMARHTAKYCPHPISVTPFGVNCSQFRPNRNHSTSNEVVIGTVKLLEDKYGIDFLIQAFALLRKQYEGARKLRLVIAGEGSSAAKLKRLAHSCGVSESTEFLGFVPQAEVPGLLNTFSIFAALSVDSESFGVAVVEAAACGLPVVVSDAGGLAEVVENGITGVIVPRRNSEAAAAAISTLILDDQKRRSMGVAGRISVLRNYEWEENASRMERFYAPFLGVEEC